MTLASDVTPFLAAADQRIADLTAANTAQAASIATLTANVTSLTGQVQSLTAQVVDLTAKLAAVTTPTPPPPSANPPLPAGWTRTLFADYFDGTAIDKVKWNVRNDGGQGNNQASNLATNVTVAGGVCAIKSGTNPAGSAKPYNAGYIDTNGKATNPVSGLWEFRARFPWGTTAYGIWDALWMRDNGGGGGEIDVMEAWPARGALHATVFADTNTGTPSTQGAQVAATWDPTQWHTYAVQKEPGILRFFYDGVMVWDAFAGADATRTAWLKSAITDNGHPWAIRICRQIGGSYGGAPTAATDLAKPLELDYVRVLGR